MKSQNRQNVIGTHAQLEIIQSEILQGMQNFVGEQK